MKVTKKEISQTLSGVKELSQATGWPVQEIGAYTMHEDVHLYVIYQGQGIDENIYTGAYDDIYEFTEFYYQWLKRDYTKQETVNRIHSALNDWLSC